MRPIRPVADQAVDRLKEFILEHAPCGAPTQDAIDTVTALWEQSRDQAAHITQMHITWMEASRAAAKEKKQSSLF